MNKENEFDVTIIGAGPAGVVAASLLQQKGWSVCILERELFPRFSIGESLLPHCTEILEEANLLEAVVKNQKTLGFQFKNGAMFHRDGVDCSFDFTKKFSKGPGTTFQVKRANFDKLLADEVEKQGVTIRYQHSVTAFDSTDTGTTLSVTSPTGDYKLQAKFTLDASGFGRVLPRLLNLEKDSELLSRTAIFTHIRDNLSSTEKGKQFDRDKILITVHPTKPDVWYWLIPFSDGTASVGVVGENSYFDNLETEPALNNTLRDYLNEDPNLSALLTNAEIIAPVKQIGGYSANVISLHGNRYALMGNSGEFLDPVFSSGVTIAFHSALLAANTLHKDLSDEQVSWEDEFAVPLARGVETFKHFVMAWYDTALQNIIFFADDNPDVKAMICSILAGYAWDESNPYVTKTKRRLATLAEICREEQNHAI
jgi:flavin-dependent dehydrogenase